MPSKSSRPFITTTPSIKRKGIPLFTSFHHIKVSTLNDEEFDTTPINVKL